MRLRTYAVEFSPNSRAAEEGFGPTTATVNDMPGTRAAIDYAADDMHLEARHVTHPQADGVATAYHSGRVVGQFTAKRVRSN